MTRISYVLVFLLLNFYVFAQRPLQPKVIQAPVTLRESNGKKLQRSISDSTVSQSSMKDSLSLYSYTTLYSDSLNKPTSNENLLLLKPKKWGGMLSLKMQTLGGTIQVSYGYQFSNSIVLSLGTGFGYTLPLILAKSKAEGKVKGFYEDGYNIPMFIQLRGYLNAKNNIKPFYFAEAGYEFRIADLNPTIGFDLTTFTITQKKYSSIGGPMFSLGAGLLVFNTDRIKLAIDAHLKYISSYQKNTVTLLSSGTLVNNEKYWSHQFLPGIGFNVLF